MSLPLSTIAKVLGMLNSTEPKYTQSQISKACGVSLSSVARIKSKALSSNEQVLDLVVLPRGVRDLRQAIRMADVCEYIGFNKPEAAIYCRKENVDINELKAFKARYGGLELCLQKESQLKQKAADEQINKLKKEIATHEKAVALANTTISVLTQSIVSGKSAALLGIDGK